MEPSTRLVTVVRRKSCTFRVILEKPSQWYEQTMEDSLLPSVTNMDTQTGVSTACHQEPQESCKPSKYTTIPKDPGEAGCSLSKPLKHFGHWTAAAGLFLFDVTAGYFKGLNSPLSLSLSPFNFFFLFEKTTLEPKFIFGPKIHIFQIFWIAKLLLRFPATEAWKCKVIFFKKYFIQIEFWERKSQLWFQCVWKDS